VDRDLRILAAKQRMYGSTNAARRSARGKDAGKFIDIAFDCWSRLVDMETAQAQPAKPFKRIIPFPAERYHGSGARGLGSALATASAE
jgi:hypothetical protein